MGAITVDLTRTNSLMEHGIVMRTVIMIYALNAEKHQKAQKKLKVEPRYHQKLSGINRMDLVFMEEKV